MKNKKIFLKIYISLNIIIITAFIILSILGNKQRAGYLSEINLNIDKTLLINNITNTITNNFIAYGKVDTEKMKNYILTNDNITNYSYHFKIGYYDKVFRYSDIYGVYPDTNAILKDYNFIKKIDFDSIGSPFGNFISYKIIDLNETYDLKYFLKVKIRLVLEIIILLFLMLIIIYFFIEYSKFDNAVITDSAPINIKNNDYIFMFIVIIAGICLFILQLYIYFPGYFINWDNIHILVLGYTKEYWNGHPVFNQVTLTFLYNIFGYNPAFFFIINLLCWYTGIVLIIISLYLKFKNKFIILLLLVSFLGDIWHSNNYQVKDVTASNYFFLSLSLLFAYTISISYLQNKLIKNITLFFSIITLVFAMVSRHNMIVTVYPIFIFFSFLILKRRKNYSIKAYLALFLKLMIIFAIILIIIFKYQPSIWIKSSGLYSNFTNHLYYLQIVGCAVLSDDDNLIPQSLYRDGKTFDDLKKIYFENRTYADILGIVFVPLDIKEVQKLWIKSIIKHPISYIKHMLYYMNEMFLLKLSFRVKKESFFYYESHNNPHYETLPKYDRNISDLNIKLFNIFYNYSISFNIYFYLVLNFIIFLILSSVFISNNKLVNDIFILNISICLSVMSTAIIVVLFTPVVTFRYIYPVIPITIISLISFITFVYDLGGWKQLIMELRSIKRNS